MHCCALAASIALNSCALQMKRLYEGSSSTLNLALSVEPAYPLATDWNDFALVADPSQICAATDLDCFHAGQIRRVQIPVGVSSCSGLTLQDALGYFDWSCSVSSGVVEFRSAPKEASSLAQLVSLAGWRMNQVTLSQNGTVIGNSSSETWWDNPVLPLPDSSAGTITLSDPKTIYVAWSHDSRGYIITGQGVSVAFPEGVLIRGVRSAANALVQATFEVNADFVSLEGMTDWQSAQSPSSWTIDAQSNHLLVIRANTVPSHYLRILRMAIANPYDQGIVFFAAAGTRLNHIELRLLTVSGAVRYDGVWIRAVYKGILEKLNLINNTRHDLVVGSGSGPLSEDTVLRQIYVRSYGKVLDGNGINADRGVRYTLSDIDIQLAGSTHAKGIGLNEVSYSTLSNAKISLGGPDKSGVWTRLSSFLRLENVWIEGSNRNGMRIETTTSSIIKNVRVYSNHQLDNGASIPPSGFRQTNASPTNASQTNIYENIQIYGAGRYGFSVENAFATLKNVFIANSGLSGMRITSNNVTLSGVTIFNSGTNGIEQTVANIQTRFHNVVVTNSTNHGILLTQNTIGHTLNQVVSTHNGGYGIYVPDPVNGATGAKAKAKFTGNILVGQNGSGDCRIPGNLDGTPGIEMEGIDDTTCFPSSPSIGQTLNAVALTASFTGPVLTDATNPLGADAIRDYLTEMRVMNGAVQGLAPIGTWGSFDHPYRAWGRYSAAAFPAPAHRSFCTSGDCQIMDFSLRSDDSVLRNRTGNANTPNDALSLNNCPSETHGTVIGTNYDSTLTFLKNAVELPDTGGNRNGLCEANESCLYTPHFGAYQGTGSLIECPYSDAGGLPGIRMYGYSSL